MCIDVGELWPCLCVGVVNKYREHYEFLQIFDLALGNVVQNTISKGPILKFSV